MQRKKFFIVIIILLVLALGSLAWYHRLTSDIEFEIPGYVFPESSWDISNHLVAYGYNDVEEGDVLAVYDFHTKERKIIRFDFNHKKASICDPWIIWEETTSDDIHLVGYNLHQGKEIPIEGDCYMFQNLKLDGNIIVWIEGDKVVGYDLETKREFLVGKESYQPDDVAISGGIITWLRGDYPNTMILGHDLQSQKYFEVLLPPSLRSSLQVSGQYVTWKEEEVDNSQNGFTIRAYHLISKELITICSGVNSLNDIHIYGDIIVWDHYRDNTGSDIFGYNLATHQRFPVCVAEGDQYTPKISGNTVVWYEDNPQERLLPWFLKKETSNLRGKTFRRWPGEKKTK